ncbi:hypothetical protein GMLC_12510 [Geomonas limicola]|uniref:Uncharacterized protein n=1 Tax=Geomonas limicola TaxID=2740186 RepID=A0A6V8N527_9BACT|nr:DUF4105 domain-containing protein [Geomonas limicola]GFO67672.1 hypothetical protein GMLC_12510 [Geomonas limicola]
MTLSRPARLLASIATLGFLVSLVFPVPASAQPAEDPYLVELQQRAVQQSLATERTWEVLLHYTRPWKGGIKSRIDDPAFFLAPGGRSEPQLELLATLAQMFKTPDRDGAYLACRFPARFAWLTSRLGIDPARLPEYRCSERDKALAAVEGRSAVLVFPVGHINSPASMFGHTLIRIDGSSKSSLISYAGNYAAVTTDTNGFVYAWKGIFGGYKGLYSLMPYYVKVKEYNDLEHRDMWEYPLNLSPDEVKAMLNHLWELQNITSSYYFLDENCSYNLLFLIEAARPSLQLTKRTGLLVLPTQTIDIALHSGILELPRYRPSQGTRIRHLGSFLDDAGRQTSWRLAHGAASPDELGRLDKKQQIAAHDAAIEFLQVRLARRELSQEEFNQKYLKLLAQRSALGAAPEELYRIPEPARPESGHQSSRASLGAGLRRGEPYAALGFQLALHTLMDPDQGYIRGAQIKFLDTALDYRLPDDGMRLRSLHLVDILSLTERDLFFKPLSWKVSTGWDTELLRDGTDHLIYRLNTGGGVAGGSPFGGIWYGLGEVDVNLGTGLRGDAALGLGVSAGALEQLTPWWKLHLSASIFSFELGDQRTRIKLSLDQNLRLAQNDSLSLLYSRQFVNRHHVEDVSLLWNHYF